MLVLHELVYVLCSGVGFLLQASPSSSYHHTHSVLKVWVGACDADTVKINNISTESKTGIELLIYGRVVETYIYYSFVLFFFFFKRFGIAY
jgi:hypothetical protein